MTKRIISFILSLILVFSFAGATSVAEEDKSSPAGEQTERVNALRPVEKEFLKTSSAKLRAGNETFEASYRSDAQPWASGVSVKDQGKSGLCWAFSVTTAAEYSYAKEIYESSGASAKTSAGHLGYFSYNRVDDPLNNTTNDKNVITDSEGWPLLGGDQIYAMQHMATWSGLAKESSYPFSRVNNHIRLSQWDNSIPYDDSGAYDDSIVLQEAVLKNLQDTTQNNAKVVKSLIKRYGAVSTSINMDGKYLNGNSFYDNSGGSTPNHAVTIVGWDDNYSKNNFATAPEGDGAWIVQNSWGTYSNDNGFFYASYYSANVSNNVMVYAFDMQPADKYDYNFQYDGTFDCGDTSDSGNQNFRTKAGTKASNVYTNTTGKTISLDAVGFTTYNDGRTNYTVDIYKNLSSETNPESGTHQNTTTASFDSCGVKTMVLSSPVTIEPGETFSIVFSFDALTYFGVEKDRSSYVDFQVGLARKQSFFKSSGGTWSDMYNNNACFRIKGFAKELNVPEPDPDTIQYHTVTFTDGFGDTLDVQSIADGEGASAPIDPKHDGYVFKGWDKSFNNVTEDITVNALWTPCYTVTFTDGFGQTISTQTVEKNHGANEPAAPTKTGYVFNGWDKDFSDITSDTIVNATWKQTCTISFNVNGGYGLASNIIVGIGDIYTLPSCPFSKTNRVFYGWSVGGIVKQPGTTILVNSDVEIKALWKYTSVQEVMDDRSMDNSVVEVSGRLLLRDTRTNELIDKTYSIGSAPSSYSSCTNSSALISQAKEELKQKANALAKTNNISFAFSVSTSSLNASPSVDDTNTNVYISEKVDANGDYYTERKTIKTGSYERTWTVTVTATATYSSVSPVVSISNGRVVLSKTNFTYNGFIQRPVVSTINGKRLAEGVDYYIVWQNASSKNAGTYAALVVGKGQYNGQTKVYYTINKAPNPLRAYGKTKTIKRKKLKKKKQIIRRSKVLVVSSSVGSVTYSKKSGNKKIKVNKNNGSITVKKGLRKGRYKVRISVQAKGNMNYSAKNVTAMVVIRVK